MSQPPGPGKVFRHIAWETLDRTPILLNNWVHPHQPGDEIWVRYWKEEPHQPVRTGPHTVVLTTPTADKVTDITPWIHHTRVKKAAASCDEGPWKAVQDPQISSRSSSKDNGPHPWRTLSPAPATLHQLAGQCTVEAWGAYYQNISGFSSSTLASIPDCYYFCALRYRTSFSHTPGLGFGSEAAVNCYLTVVGSLILIRMRLIRSLLIESPY